MKLASFIASGEPRYGALVDDQILVDIPAFAAANGVAGTVASSVRGLLELGAEGMSRAHDLVDQARRLASERRLSEGCIHPADAVRWLAPVPDPTKIVAIGQNYKDHCEEQNVPYPEYPTVFAKFPSSLIGHLEEIVYPSETRFLDYEVELAVVIGAPAKDVPLDSWREVVAGYTVMNDVTARDIQKCEKQWVRGKSFDTFAPCGPFLITADEIDDPGTLDLWLTVNSEVRQSSNTNQLVFDVPFLVTHLSRSFSLFPGDIIITGTPGGVGMYRDPPALLQRGDVVELGVEGVCVLRNRVV